MSMFDTLVVPDSLVDNSVLAEGDNWQTKSLERRGYQYEITSEGRLLLNNPPFAKEGAEPIDQEMHGYITFYNSVGVVRTPMWKWIEYTAKFTDGKLVKIEANHQSHADQGIVEIDEFCSKCGQAWATHNGDGSCVLDEKQILAAGRYCDKCRVPGHDACSMTEGCPCCENTKNNS